MEGGSPDTWDRMYAMNLRSAAVSCAAVLPHLSEAGAAIVNVGAAGAIAPAKGMAAYAASKAGVQALGESLADELRGRHIRVNTVQPTIIDTPANHRDMPGARADAWIAPLEIAKVAAFLLSPDASAITGASILLSH